MPNHRPTPSYNTEKSRPRVANDIPLNAQEQRFLTVRLAEILHGYIENYPVCKHQGQLIVE